MAAATPAERRRVRQQLERRAVRAAQDTARRSAADAYIQRIVDAAPPLSPEQRDYLALLLRPVDRSTT
jgi:hypothetical protein